MKERIEAILKLDLLRTQGSWRFDRGRESSEVCTIEPYDTICCNTNYYPTHVLEQNQEFIAAAPEMVSIIKEMQEREKKLVEALRWYTIEENIDDYIGIYDGFNNISNVAREALKEVESC